MIAQEHEFDEQQLRAEVAEDEPDEGDLDDDDGEDREGADEDEDYGSEGGDLSESAERSVTHSSTGKVDNEADQTFPASDPPANY